MGHGDDVGSRQETVVGEVGDVGGHHTGVQRRQHGFIVYDLARARLMTRTPRFMAAMALASIMWAVFSV